MSLNSFGNKLRSGPLGVVFFVIVVLCVGVLAFTGLGSYVNNRQQPQAAAPSPSDTVATINGTPVSVSQFQNAIEQYKQEYESYGPEPSIAQAGQTRVAAFNQLEQPILEAGLAKQHGLTISSDELAAGRTKALAPYKQQLGLPASASDSDMNNALAQYHRTVDDLIDPNKLKVDLLAQKYEEYLGESNAASEDTVKKYYQQVHVRHIEISNKRLPDAQASALAAVLIGRIQKGADFATIAKQYSDDVSTKNKGGDDGFIDESTPYPPAFKSAALALKPGQVTPTAVLLPDYGYFIIQAIASKSNLPKDYQKNHQQYVQQVTNSLAQQQEQTDLAAAKAQAKIVATDPRLNADLAVSNLPSGTPNASVLQGALANYEKALTNADDSEKAEIYASEAQVYQLLHEPDKQLSATNLALNNIEDSQLRLNLGDLYKQKSDVKDALAQYQIASDHAYDNEDIHLQLLQDYQSLKQPALVARESSWLKEYQARQKQANSQTVPTPTQQH